MKKQNFFRKKILKGIALCFLLLTCVMSIDILLDTIKIKDPKNQNFNPDSFEFNNYPREGRTLVDILPDLLPIGTPKTYVDRVFINAGGATAHEDRNYKNMFWYEEPTQLRDWKGAPRHIVIFDEDDNLINIAAYQTHEIFSNQMSIQQFRKVSDKKDRP